MENTFYAQNTSNIFKKINPSCNGEYTPYEDLRTVNL